LGSGIGLPGHKIPGEAQRRCTVTVALLLFVRRVALLAQAFNQHAVQHTVSRNVQSIVTLLRKVATGLRAMVRRISSPSTLTALSFRL
jgi:hypothetical protein